MDFWESLQGALRDGPFGINRDIRGAISNGPFDIFRNFRGNNAAFNQQMDNWAQTGDLSNFNLGNIFRGGLQGLGDTFQGLVRDIPPIFGGPPAPGNTADSLPLVAQTDIDRILGQYQTLTGNPLDQTTINALGSTDPRIQWQAYQSINDQINQYQIQQQQKEQGQAAIGQLQTGQGFLENLRNIVNSNVNNPLFSEGAIRDITERNVEGLGEQFAQGMDLLSQNLTSRGLNTSGIAAGEESRLREGVGRNIAATRRDTPISLREMNDKVAQSWLGLGTQLGGMSAQYDQAIAAAQAGLPIPAINTGAISSAISSGAQEVADYETMQNLIESGQWDKIWNFISNAIGMGSQQATGLLSTLMGGLLQRRNTGNNSSSSFPLSLGLSI